MRIKFIFAAVKLSDLSVLSHYYWAGAYASCANVECVQKKTYEEFCSRSPPSKIGPSINTCMLHASDLNYCVNPAYVYSYSSCSTSF